MWRNSAIPRVLLVFNLQMNAKLQCPVSASWPVCVCVCVRVCVRACVSVCVFRTTSTSRQFLVLSLLYANKLYECVDVWPVSYEKSVSEWEREFVHPVHLRASILTDWCTYTHMHTHTHTHTHTYLDSYLGNTWPMFAVFCGLMFHDLVVSAYLPSPGRSCIIHHQ